MPIIEYNTNFINVSEHSVLVRKYTSIAFSNTQSITVEYYNGKLSYSISKLKEY